MGKLGNSSNTKCKKNAKQIKTAQKHQNQGYNDDGKATAGRNSNKCVAPNYINPNVLHKKFQLVPAHAMESNNQNYLQLCDHTQLNTFTFFCVQASLYTQETFTFVVAALNSAAQSDKAASFALTRRTMRNVARRAKVL